MYFSRLLLIVPLGFGLCAVSSPAKNKETGRIERARENSAKGDKDWKRATEGHRPQDLNGDGAITRNEWPGNDVSFRQLDRDGDGVLTSKDRGPGTEAAADAKRYDRSITDKGKPKKGTSK